MIKRVKLFINENDISKKVAKIVKAKLESNGFIVTDLNYDLAIALGGDGSFLRMVNSTSFNSDIYFTGINTGTLGFLQEIKLDDIDIFIDELKKEKYKVEEIGIQETIVIGKNYQDKFFSLNEIVLRDYNLNATKLKIKIEDKILENFVGDGILIATSVGSTAYNLSLGGSIVDSTFSTLQITPIAPINSKVYRSLVNSIIIPSKKTISIFPDKSKNDILLTVDGNNKFYKEVKRIDTIINNKKIKCLRMSHYYFSTKINEKLLTT